MVLAYVPLLITTMPKLERLILDGDQAISTMPTIYKEGYVRRFKVVFIYKTSINDILVGILTRVV